MLGQQMLNITVEEKENRVTEMILTTIRPRVLIPAKITAVIVAGLVQAAVFLVPALIWLGTTGYQLSTRSPAPRWGCRDRGRSWCARRVRLAVRRRFRDVHGAAGRDRVGGPDRASSAFGGLVLAMFIPLYVTPLVASEPDSLITRRHLASWTARLLRRCGMRPGR